ncbi:MAG: ComF family protein [Gammaproteobacteria bacterium]|nr:ComF family protein [Gammaproteobacteria bacterium]
MLAPLLYQAPVSDLVARFKYHARLDLGRILASELLAAVSYSDCRPALLLPVPMDPSGLRRRGYNQASELARWLSCQLGIPWSAGHLERIRSAAHQRELDRAHRQRNLRGVFSCRGRLPEHVALVDDVVTTGATVNEISATLRRAGVQEIEIWAVARTPATRGP